ncbi:hypothetical protein C1645_814924 [Glomus cerebriforme]|uniref:Galactose oxidase n=1 Tax=Glomus cerebriforme TaxID=658196 RepID=A0A397TEQ8_9GLOM|nr:hypothetical protein C1645_814924 [Glomus cerebriforme]
MLKNSLVYLILFNLIQFWSVEIDCFQPSQRYLHTATFIDNKLYILGGRDKLDTSIETIGKDFFYRDFSTSSVNFNSQELSWLDLSNVNIVPPHKAAAAVKGGVNNDILFLYGGNSTDNDMALVYTFDTKSNSWSIPNITNMSGEEEFSRKAFLTGIIDNGSMYLWGGVEEISKYSVNDMLILDTINLSWRKGSLVNTPSPRRNYGATLLPNHQIIYMGGSNYTNITLNEVYLYDTINDSWDTKTTSGIIPSSREGFSVNLGLDGQRVIIFGGIGVNSTDALYVLNLSDFKWYIPKVSGTIPESRNNHKANVIGNYLVITFGQSTKTIESDVLFLDISNNDEYIWTENLSGSPSKSKVICVIIGSTIGGVLLIIGMFLLYKWNKNRRLRRNAVHPPDVEQEIKHKI